MDPALLIASPTSGPRARPLVARYTHLNGQDGVGPRLDRFDQRDLACRLQALFAASIDALILTDEKRCIIDVSPTAERLLGCKHGALVDRPLEQVVAVGSRNQLSQLFQAARTCRTGDAACELLVLTCDGMTQPVEMYVAEAHIDSVCRWAVALHDLSHRRCLEKEILETEALQRRQIGEDLHDDVGQLLTGIGLLCRKLQRRLAGRGLEEADDAARIEGFIKEATAKARTLARELVPTSLQATELPAALRELAARTEYLFDVQCRLDLEGTSVSLDDTIAPHLFRIAQEACHNAIKHGGAGRLTIRLANADAALILSVIDAGRGFTSLSIEKDGLGLRLMRHRARLIGATLSFDMNVLGGVTLTCTLPLLSQADPSSHPTNRHVQPGS